MQSAMIILFVPQKHKFVFILFLISISIWSPLFVYANESFQNLNIQNGLAHTDANCVAQDHSGLIWIGTYGGLQYFDGYQLQSISFYPPNQKIYESHNRINALECGQDRLWIGTDSGLTCLDLKTHLYIPYTIATGDSSDFSQQIFQLAIDTPNQRLWIYTENRLWAVQIEEADNKLYTIEWKNESEQQSVRSYAKPVVHQGDLWTITDGYLFRLSVENSRISIKNKYKTEDLLKSKTTINALFATGEFLYLRSERGCYRFPFTDSEIDTSTFAYADFHQINPEIPDNTSGIFTVGKNETLWCSYFGGIFEVTDPFTGNGTITPYLENNPNINFSLTRIKSLFIDKFNNLWVSMASKGVYFRSLSSTPFHYLSNAKFRNAGFSKNEITSVAVQDNKALWMIVEGGSLYYYDLKTHKLDLVSLPISRGAADGLQTLTLSADQKKLYIGSFEGLIEYQITTGRSHWLLGRQSKTLPYSISIFKIKEDKWGRLWVCSWGKGIYCIKDISSSPSLAYYLHSQGSSSIISNFVTDIYVENSAIVLCTTHGLSKIWLDGHGGIGDITVYQANDSIQHSMSSNYIACIDRQNDSTYWIGTIGGGVNQLVIHSAHDNDYSAVCYTENNGLTSNDSEIIYLDTDQNVWVGGKGIVRINPGTEQVSAYHSREGLQNNSFKIGAGCRAGDGTIFMGSTDGLCYFRPSDLKNDAYPMHSNLVLTNLYINNQRVIPQTVYDGGIPLSKILNQTDHVCLTHNQNNFIISFSALAYSPFNQIMYRYRMKGFDKAWRVIPHAENRVYFSNLPYGNYSFELQVSLDRGVTWSTPGRIVQFSIFPPLWLSNWAKLLYVFMVLSISAMIIYQYRKEQKLKRENHIKELERINEEERYQSKMRFFMNVSHELKTPLTLIMLSAEKLMETVKSGSVTTIWNNSKRMLSLISELIDMKKADLGVNELVLTHQNIAILVEQLYSEIKPWAEKKNIYITCIQEEKELQMDFDWDKIGKLIINLLSNAVKYTQPGGAIKITLKKAALKDIRPLYSTIYQEGKIQTEKPACILIVEDTGIGISPDSIRHIYERFFQVDPTHGSHLGTGLGLAIAKTMTLVHHGSILVSSERNRGTEFVVALPILDKLKSVSGQEDGSAFDAKSFIDSHYSEYSPQENEEGKIPREDRYISGLPTLLVVEDNKEMQQALYERLHSSYQICFANNGKAGLEICKSIFPDIIISDVMMPEMNGIEMCRQIRDDLSVAYIPIILLTAKGNVEHQIEGYESGADLYIPKPFSIRLLQVNLKRLLKLKESLLQKEIKITREDEENKEFSLQDDKDLWQQQLDRLIKENISNTGLSVEFICEALGISRSSLYNKMKEYNHQPLADYIRNIRLTMAADLLLHTSYTMNEIVMEVGLVNSSHFSKIFKMKYGVSPSEYKSTH